MKTFTAITLCLAITACANFGNRFDGEAVIDQGRYQTTPTYIECGDCESSPR